jgi:hypothetical protein
VVTTSGVKMRLCIRITVLSGLAVIWYLSRVFLHNFTGRLAQLVARQIPNLKVRSSILLLVTTFFFGEQNLFEFWIELFLNSSDCHLQHPLHVQ